MSLTNIVVASMPRSGSALLCEALAQHPSVLGFGELFNQDGKVRAGSHGIVVGDEGRNAFAPGAQRPADYLDFLESLGRLRGKQAISYKLMREHYRSAWDAVQPRARYYLHLRRDNPIEALASHKVSMLSGQWHARTDDDCQKVEAVTVNLAPSDVLAALREDRHFSLRMESDDMFPCLHVPYSALVGAFRGTMAEVFRFCELDPFEPQMTQVKLNRRPLSEMVVNIEQVRETIANSGYPEALSYV